MNTDRALMRYHDELHAHTWTFAPYTFPTRALRRRDDDLTDARDALATAHDLERHP